MEREAKQTLDHIINRATRLYAERALDGAVRNPRQLIASLLAFVALDTWSDVSGFPRTMLIKLLALKGRDGKHR